jgi:3-isopropylmalate dehydratase small subunit
MQEIESKALITELQLGKIESEGVINDLRSINERNSALIIELEDSKSKLENEITRLELKDSSDVDLNEKLVDLQKKIKLLEVDKSTLKLLSSENISMTEDFEKKIDDLKSINTGYMCIFEYF